MSTAPPDRRPFHLVAMYRRTWHELHAPSMEIICTAGTEADAEHRARELVRDGFFVPTEDRRGRELIPGHMVARVMIRREVEPADLVDGPPRRVTSGAQPKRNGRSVNGRRLKLAK
jgi:hypothetical protein